MNLLLNKLGESNIGCRHWNVVYLAGWIILHFLSPDLQRIVSAPSRSRGPGHTCGLQSKMQGPYSNTT